MSIALQYVSVHQRSQINSTFKLKLNLQPYIHLHLYLTPSDRPQLRPGFIIIYNNNNSRCIL